jgi:hypothetical protein
MAPVTAVLLGILFAVSACSGSGPGSGPSSSAALSLADTSPLTVRGSGFQPGERVRLDLGSSGATTLARASGRGSFRASFDVPVTRCDRIRVIAIGSKGSRVVLKRLPAPACLPVREK